MKNNQNKKKVNNTVNNFHPKSINIVEISSVSSHKKPPSPHIYNTFFTNETTKKSKYHNHKVANRKNFCLCEECNNKMIEKIKKTF